jgi:hypothetical protein
MLVKSALVLNQHFVMHVISPNVFPGANILVLNLRASFPLK